MRYYSIKKKRVLERIRLEHDGVINYFDDDPLHIVNANRIELDGKGINAVLIKRRRERDAV